MELKETIKEIISQFHEMHQPKTIQRNQVIPLNLKKVISLIGVRRCGKTFLLYDTINRLIAQGISKENILYINFEDERLNLKTNDLDYILQAWRELHSGKEIIEQWFFLDEIQNIDGWEKFIRRIYDTVTQNIFITGSNSALLAKEIATSLRGRTLQYEVFPYSFNEYLNHLKISYDYYSPQNKALIINKFNEYLFNGGFPEATGYNEPEHSDMLRSYFYVMLYKDLIERYNISSSNVLKYFIEKLVDNLTKSFSINKIYNELRSQGFKMDKNLLYELLIYIENIYLTFKISKLDFSYSKRTKSDKKVYFIDNGLVNILTNSFSGDKGKMLENTVFLYLRSYFGDIFNDNLFYHKTNKECDFVLSDRQKALAAIQVCYDISHPDTLKREIEGLQSAMSAYNLKNGFIITGEQEDEILQNNQHIQIIPAYKLFIDHSLDIFK